MEVVIDDLENKKQFIARFGAECHLCRKSIRVGEPLFFMGATKQTCLLCLTEIKQSLKKNNG